MSGGGLTRRGALGGGLAGAALVMGRAGAGQGAADYEARLRAWLAAVRRPTPDSTLTLVDFARSGSAIEATVRLDWLPGRRQRRIVARADEPEQAFAALTAGITRFLA